MGKMGASASRDRSSQDTSEQFQSDTTGTMAQTKKGTKQATFDSPQAQAILAALTAQTAGQPSGALGQYGQQAGGAFGALANETNPVVNPYVENIISASNKEGDAALGTGLAQVRGGAYRGGTGAGMYGQGSLVANAANTRAKENAALRYGAFDTGQGRALTARLGGASGLAGLESTSQQAKQGQQQLAAQILALLRGETSLDEITGTNVSTTKGTSVGKSSGTRSQTGAQAQVGWTGAGGWG